VRVGRDWLGVSLLLFSSLLLSRRSAAHPGSLSYQERGRGQRREEISGSGQRVTLSPPPPFFLSPLLQPPGMKSVCGFGFSFFVLFCPLLFSSGLNERRENGMEGGNGVDLPSDGGTMQGIDHSDQLNQTDTSACTQLPRLQRALLCMCGWREGEGRRVFVQAGKGGSSVGQKEMREPCHGGTLDTPLEGVGIADMPAVPSDRHATIP